MSNSVYIHVTLIISHDTIYSRFASDVNSVPQKLSNYLIIMQENVNKKNRTEVRMPTRFCSSH